MPVKELGRIDVSAPISDAIRKNGALSPKELGRQIFERLRETDRREASMRRRDWVKYILYDQGEQRIRWNSGARGYQRLPRDRKLQRCTANMLGVRGDHWVADVTQSMPFYSGTPENTDLESKSIAKLAEVRVGAYWSDLNLDQARTLAARDIWTCGGGFIEAGWDPSAGPIVANFKRRKGIPAMAGEDDPYGYEVDPQTGYPRIDGYTTEGAAFAHEVSPLLVYLPCTVDRPQTETSPWMQRLEWATEERIRQLADGGKLPNGFNFFDDPEFAYVDDALAVSSEHATNAREEGGLHLIVHHYELRAPDEDFQKGKHWIACGDQVITTEDLDGEGDRYPLFYFGGRPRKRTFWCQAEIADRIPSQRRRNDVLTHLLAWLGRYAMPNLLAEKGSEVPEQYGMYGETIFFARGYNPPVPQQPPPPSPALFQMLSIATEELDETGGDMPASRGVAVSSPSGHYLSLLQDAAAKRYGPMVRQHAWSWARLGEYLCKISAKHETDDKIISVVGRGNRPELIRMRGVARLGAVRFRVSETSLVSALPSARVEQLTKLMQEGALDRILGPPPWPPAIRRALIDFTQTPALGELEFGSGKLDRWADGVLTRLIEEAQPVEELDPLMDPLEAQALLEALNGRKLDADRYEWSEEIVQNVAQLKQMLEAKVQEAKDEAEGEQDKGMGKQVQAQIGVARGESAARASEKSAVAFAKARAEAMKDLIAPPPPAPSEFSEDGPASEGEQAHA